MNETLKQNEIGSKTEISFYIKKSYMGENYSGDPEEKWKITHELRAEVDLDLAKKIAQSVAQLLTEL